MLAVRVLAAVAASAAISTTVAGPLIPPAGSPSPTYKTLQQVEPRGDINAINPLGAFDHPIFVAGSYYLTDNINSSSTYQIGVLTDNIVIDLNGFTIDGQDAAAACILVNFPGGSVTIRNGTLVGSKALAIEVSNPNTTRVVLEDVTVKECVGGVQLGFGGSMLRCLVSGITGNTPAIVGASDVTVRETSVAGINAVGMNLGDRATVQHVRVRSTGGVGILAGTEARIEGATVTDAGDSAIFTGDRANVRDVVVLNPGDRGVSVGARSTVTNAVVDGANATGILTGAGSRIEGSVAENCSADGITAGSDNVIVNCIARGNGDDGIESSGSSVIENCVANFNVDEGIFVGTGSIVRGCTAAQNDSIGILAGFSSNIQSCTVYNNGSHGIQINGDSTVRFCQADNNGRLTSSGAGIRNIGSGTVIDSCGATDNDEGIFAVNDTLVMRCFADGNGTDYLIAPGMPVTPIANLSTAGPFDNIEGF